VIQQLEIRWVDLNPTVGAETRKKRPCIVLQSDVVNRKSRTVIVAPILPDHKTWPFVVNIEPSSKNKLDKPRHINLKQLRAVDTSRVTNLQGSLESHYLPDIEEAISVVFGLR